MCIWCIIHNIHNIQKGENMKERLNLLFDKELKDYLKQVSWENHMSITEYLVNLIKQDMKKRNRKE